MDRKDFYYELPEELIAQTPLKDRAASRLMVFNKEDGGLRHRHFRDILDYLEEGDCLVLNDTKVIPSRLMGENANGAKVETLLLKRVEGDLWEVLTKPGKRSKIGAKINFGGILSCSIEGIADGGVRLARFEYEGIFEEILDRLGEMPLPPYITEKLDDKSRYQTVYAKNEGSAAAPTAGFHFTKELMEELAQKGVKIAKVTLHVGLGTFRPVKVDNLLEHKMHSEYCRIDESQAEIINSAKAAGKKVIAVGTTSCRSIESFAEKGVLKSGAMETDIFIYPGYKFQIADGLITNFHLPESTLIMLISALSKREYILCAYEEAVRKKYRFFSFGDAMLII